jgi:BASS family bile acid:Na+ symporter
MQIGNIIKKNTWLIVLLAIVLGFILPDLGFFLQPSVVYLLMLLMLFSVLDMSYRKVWEQLHDYKKTLAALAVVHLAGPLMALVVKPFVTEEIFLGLVIATVINAGVSVVFLSKLYGGLPSKALVITAVSHILSPVLVPFLVITFAKTSIAIDPVSISWTIIKLVIIPIILSMFVRRSRLYQPMKKHGGWINIILLFLIIIGIIAPIREIILNDVSRAVYVGLIVMLVVIIDFALGFALGKNKAERVTYGVSTSYKNYVLSNVVALSLFGPVVALPAAMYAVANNVLLVPLQFLCCRSNKKKN